MAEECITLAAGMGTPAQCGNAHAGHSKKKRVERDTTAYRRAPGGRTTRQSALRVVRSLDEPVAFQGAGEISHRFADWAVSVRGQRRPSGPRCGRRLEPDEDEALMISPSSPVAVTVTCRMAVRSETSPIGP